MASNCINLEPIWDGRQLMTPYETRREPTPRTTPPRRPRGSVVTIEQRVLVELASGPKTNLDLFAVAGCPLETVRQAIYRLVRSGAIQRITRQPNGHHREATYARVTR